MPLTFEGAKTNAENLVSASMDAEYLDQADRANYAAQAQVWATLAAALSNQPQPTPTPPAKVWVATVSDENDSPGPAVYVSDTDDHLVTVIRKQQGIPDDAELLEWLDERGKVAVWDSYYVETGEES